MNDVLEAIERIKVVPVVVINDVGETLPLMKALVEGDVPVAEITFRTPCAAEAIRVASSSFPDAIVGAGTVIDAKQAEEAIEAGAKFLVSPGLSEEVYAVAKEKNVPYLPGVVTPTEVMKALSLGLDHLKFFPAGVYGGLKAINALGSVFPNVSFMPTGGVGLENLSEFVSNKRIFAVGGSFLTKGGYDDIKKNCLKARAIVKENL